MGTAIYLTATTGMRRGEVLGLRWGDLDLDARRVSVHRTLIAIAYETAESTVKTRHSRRSSTSPTTPSRSSRRGVLVALMREAPPSRTTSSSAGPTAPPSTHTRSRRRSSDSPCGQVSPSSASTTSATPTPRCC
jgi:integrase